MNAASSRTKAWAQVLRVCVFLALIAIVWFATRHFPGSRQSSLILTLGCLLLLGGLAGKLSELLFLPQLTGFLLLGVLLGPHVLGLIEGEAATDLTFVNTMALSLIALAGGAELRLEQLRAGLRGLAWATVFQTGVGLVVSSVAFVLFARYLPFTQSFGKYGVLGLGLIWGVFAISRSPSATLAILSQTRADGPVSRFSVAFIMSSDIVVVVLLTTVMMFVQPLMDPGRALSLSSIGSLGHEVLSSVSLGATVGVFLTLYLRLIGRQLLLMLLGVGYALTEGLRHLHFDPLLTFVVAGFMLQNFSRQGPKLLHAIESTGAIVYVVFFATAGVALDVALLKQLWPIALALCAVRGISSWLAHVTSSRVARDNEAVRRWGWTSLLSQAGLTLGLAGLVENAFPGLGGGFRSLVIATVAINQMFGPILFKFALDRSGESGAAPAHSTA
jgi:Kef-type K+ transport system membrane component KefB